MGLRSVWILGQASDFFASVSNHVKLTTNEPYSYEFHTLKSQFLAHVESGRDVYADIHASKAAAAQFEILAVSDE